MSLLMEQPRMRSAAAPASCGECGLGLGGARSLTAAVLGGRAVMLCDAHAAGDVTAPPAAEPTSEAYFASAPDA